jgi:hypothetical protein
VGAVCDELEETLGGPPDSSGKWNCDMSESITGEVATSVTDLGQGEDLGVHQQQI